MRALDESLLNLGELVPVEAGPKEDPCLLM